MRNNQEEMQYTFRRTKLSTLYEEIGKYLREHGDADIRSIVSHNGCDEVSYTLKLADLNTFDTSCVGKIEAKYEDVPYTKEEWQNGVVTVSKIDTAYDAQLKTFTVDSLLGHLNPEFRGVCNKYDNKAEGIIKQWVKECCELDVESTSSWGMFFQMLMMKYSAVVIDFECRRQQLEALNEEE